MKEPLVSRGQPAHNLDSASNSDCDVGDGGAREARVCGPDNWNRMPYVSLEIDLQRMRCIAGDAGRPFGIPDTVHRVFVKVASSLILCSQQV